MVKTRYASLSGGRSDHPQALLQNKNLIMFVYKAPEQIAGSWPLPSASILPAPVPPVLQGRQTLQTNVCTQQAV